LTSNRIACRTLTSLNGAWSTRIVKGVIAPVCEVTVRTPPVDFSAAICAPSRAPAPWITPVTRAFCRGGAVAEIDDRQRVDVRQARLPVVGVPDEHAALARREALVLERPRAVWLARVEPDRTTYR
jgi:hypothetical protein